MAGAGALDRAAAIAVPLLFIGIAWPALRENSATWDETAHVPAGFTYLTRADFRLNPEHPPLVKALFALPLLALSPSISPETERAFDAAPGEWNHLQWIFGYRFLNRDNRPQPLLFRARLVVLLLGTCVVVLVYVWARDLFGAGGGAFAASLLALDPNFIAHATLATTDVGAVLFFTSCVYCFRLTFRRANVAHVLTTGLAAGAACVAKFSTILLVPTFLILGVLATLRPEPWPIVGGKTVRTSRGRAAMSVTLLVCWGLIAWGCIWATYGFRHTASPGTERRLEIAAMARNIRLSRLIAEARDRGTPFTDERALQARADVTPPDLQERFILWAARHRLLPEAYVYGLAFAAQGAAGRPSFLLGRVSLTGSRAYFPICFGAKTPVATLAVVAAALALGARRLFRLRRRGEAAFLLVPATAIALTAIHSRLNIGHRHLLGLYPFLYIYAGALPGQLKSAAGRVAGLWAPLAMVILLGAETIAARPYFIPFFNVLAGGARGGMGLLSDSNLDWGQGLPALQRWMREQGVQRVNLCYFGTADPAAYGIAFVPLPGTYHLGVPGAGEAGYPAEQPELPGYVAIGATHLQGVYLKDALRRYYEFLGRKTPITVLGGGAMYVYWVDRWGE